MYRKERSFGPRLEALMDERDHLLIQISMERDSQRPSPDKIEMLCKKVAQIEDQIRRDWSDGASSE